MTHCGQEMELCAIRRFKQFLLSPHFEEFTTSQSREKQKLLTTNKEYVRNRAKDVCQDDMQNHPVEIGAQASVVECERNSGEGYNVAKM